MRHAPRALLAGGLGFAVSFLVACGGSSGLLSSDQANSLNSALDNVGSAVSSGDCRAARSSVDTFSSRVAGLPSSVSATLRDSLSQDANRLAQLAPRDCLSATTTTSTTSTTTTPTTSTTATRTASSTTTTSTTTITNTTSTPATTTGGSGTTSTASTTGSGGVGIGGNGGGGGGSGGAGTGGSGNGVSQ